MELRGAFRELPCIPPRGSPPRRRFGGLAHPFVCASCGGDQVSEQRLVCLHRSAENGTSNIPVSAGGVPSAPPPVASAEQRNSDATFHVFQMSVPLLLLLLLGCRDLPAAPESEACSVAKGTAFA